MHCAKYTPVTQSFIIIVEHSILYIITRSMLSMTGNVVSVFTPGSPKTHEPLWCQGVMIARASCGQRSVSALSSSYEITLIHGLPLTDTSLSKVWLWLDSKGSQPRCDPRGSCSWPHTVSLCDHAQMTEALGPHLLLKMGMKITTAEAIISA